MAPGKLPLRRDFFQCPPLDNVQTTTLMQHAKNGLDSMVEMARFQGGPITWTLESDRDGVQQYAGTGALAPPGALMSLYVANVKGTLDAAVDLMRVTTQDEFAAFCTNYTDDVVDCATLYTVDEKRQEPREYVGVRWQCYASPTSLIMGRDLCVVEAQHDVQLNHGFQGWARCMQSVELDCCPSLQESHHLIRAWLHYGGFLVTETPTPGELQIINIQCLDLKGNLPQFLVKLSAKRQTKTLQKIRDNFTKPRKPKPVESIATQNPRKKCMLCKVGRQRLCSTCRQSVCVHCNKYWKMTTADGRKIRVCYTCSSQPIASIPSDGPTTRSEISLDDSVISDGSDLTVSSMTEHSFDRARPSSHRFDAHAFGFERKMERFSRQ
ncbi:unnamed protein product [Aphanomyces euteiches]|uniref:START domain-containing protein n=1 Tax=Aphanomyces euteiches TaxID=100861 RepID=A0A6G0W8V3_9STRA|nr:hypothetical protein Ae201684_017552 [Aphanomyces euteiches]KAH9068655.1 hypothetical protein Ae201684P_004357 [Aphanomyces euteiches]KAH9155361.1 hypothetical protein AeRB84_002656 [Aphanomyces euteiches]